MVCKDSGEFQPLSFGAAEYFARSAGPIVRITPNEYSLDGPEAIRAIYGHGTQFIKVTRACLDFTFRHLTLIIGALVFWQRPGRSRERQFVHRLRHATTCCKPQKGRLALFDDDYVEVGALRG